MHKLFSQACYNLWGENMKHYEQREKINMKIPTEKRGGGNVMIRGCFAASGPEHFALL